MRIMRCVLSGSYRRDFATLERQYRELAVNGCQVLSPHRLDFADPQAEFVKDTAETALSPGEIEAHHLLAIRQADFVWLHCPSGYIGISAAVEIGFAAGLNIPVFSNAQPREVVFERLVTVVPSVFMALENIN